ncbi:MAG: hypothetical protein HPY55_13765 [Firmicutes bacterium]|nr:hypothetical protein [Bacillota bacterium]
MPGSNRTMRSLLLVVVAVIIFANLLFLEVAQCVEGTTLKPAFILGVLDHPAFYQKARDVVVTELLQSFGAIPAEARRILQSAMSEAITPELVREQAAVLVPVALKLLKDPAAKPELNVDVTPFKTAITRVAARQPAIVAAQVSRATQALPDGIDLVKQLMLNPAEVSAILGRYQDFRQDVSRSIMFLGLAVITCVLLAGRRGWGPWLGAPVLLSGVSVAGMASLGRALISAQVSAVVATAVKRVPTIGPSLDPTITGALAENAVAGFSRALFLTGTVAAVAGLALVAVWAAVSRSERQAAAR